MVSLRLPDVLRSFGWLGTGEAVFRGGGRFGRLLRAGRGGNSLFRSPPMSEKGAILSVGVCRRRDEFPVYGFGMGGRSSGLGRRVAEGLPPGV